MCFTKNLCKLKYGAECYVGKFFCSFCCFRFFNTLTQKILLDYSKFYYLQQSMERHEAYEQTQGKPSGQKHLEKDRPMEAKGHFQVNSRREKDFRF